MRRFSLANLRDFGMGKKACEDKIIEECHHLIETVKHYKGKMLSFKNVAKTLISKYLQLYLLFDSGEAFDTTQPIYYAVSNIISSMIYGSRFEYDDLDFRSLVERLIKMSKVLSTPSVQV